MVRERMQLREQEIHGTWLTEAKMSQKKYSATHVCIYFWGVQTYMQLYCIICSRHICFVDGWSKNESTFLSHNVCVYIGLDLPKEGHHGNCVLLFQVPQHAGEDILICTWCFEFPILPIVLYICMLHLKIMTNQVGCLIKAHLPHHDSKWCLCRVLREELEIWLQRQRILCGRWVQVSAQTQWVAAGTWRNGVGCI